MLIRFGSVDDVCVYMEKGSVSCIRCCIRDSGGRVSWSSLHGKRTFVAQLALHCLVSCFVKKNYITRAELPASLSRTPPTASVSAILQLACKVARGVSVD